jgi:tRNA-splicing ligase RtcB (3'-phosphate/5'-hydroxy nucleic acid ligase)
MPNNINQSDPSQPDPGQPEPQRVGNVLSWLPENDRDPRTIEQAQLAANLPFVVKPLALMPDAHIGMGATIGSVIATNGSIVPAAVGVDIGCGMAAARTELTSHDLPDNLGQLHGRIRRSVPAGIPSKRSRATGSHRDVAEAPALTELMTRLTTPGLAKTLATKVGRQFGTLGSGNHFVEICLDETDRVWVVLHSGSRGIGNQLAQEYIRTAKGVVEAMLIDLPDANLAHLVEGSPEFDEYVNDMLWAQDYAKQNRAAMLEAVLTDMRYELDRPIAVEQVVNCHHNYCERERHNGADVWVTRKGAIRAQVGDLGVIPGSMGTSSYIVRGRGNPASYNSASHGAGRRMSRAKARKSFDVDSLRDEMGDRTWNERQANQLLDEHPGAYKDIDEVMNAQADLVDVVHRLHQILNFKGA